MERQESYVRTRSSQRMQRRSSWTYVIIGFSIFIALLIIGTFVALFVIYFIRYRNARSTILSYPNFICSNHPCGCPKSNNTTSLTSKIVGGKDASPYMHPWLVTLTDRYRTDPFCAGFIISSKVILTAAHCIYGRNSNDIQILSKVHDLRDFHGDRHNIDQLIIHPKYHMNDSMHLNDIALIKIEKSFANDLQPCCLPKIQSNHYPQAKREAVLSGWGKVLPKPQSQNSPILQYVVMPIVDEKNSKCQQSIADRRRQICAGYDDLPIDACSGDSGAPLLVVEYDSNSDQGYFVAAGIVSYGNRKCDASLSSGVYTRISFYLDWIYQTSKFM